MRYAPWAAWFAAFGFVFAAAPVRAQEAGRASLADHFPDRTLVFATIDDVARTAKACEATTLGRIWDDPQVQAFLESSLTALGGFLGRIEKESGFRFADLKACFSNRAAAGYVPPAGRGAGALLVVTDTPDGDTARRLIRGAAQLGRRYLRTGIVVDANGVTRIPLRGATLSLARRGKRLFIAVDERGESLPGLLNVAKPLSGAEAFGRTMRNLGARPDVTAFVNLAPLWAMARNAANQPNTQMAYKAVEGLGLTGLRGAGLSLTADAPGFTRRMFVFAPRPRTGLLTLVRPAPVSRKLLSAVPATAQQFAGLRLDLGGLTKVVREAAAAANVPADVINTLVQLATLQLGFNPETDLIGAMGDEAAFVMIDGQKVGGIPLLGLNGLAILVRLKDPAKFSRAMQRVAQIGAQLAANSKLGGGLLEMTHRGRTIRGVRLVTAVAAPSYAVVDDLFILSTGPPAIQAIIDCIDGQAPSLAGRGEFRDLMKRLGGDKTSGVSFAEKPDLSAGPAGGLATMGVLAGLLLPALAKARGSARRMNCKSNLRQVGLGIATFEVDQGRYPKTVEELFDKYIDDRMIFECPARPGGGYLYLSGVRGADGAGAIVAYDAADNHGVGEGRNVLFADFHVEWTLEDIFQERLEKQLAKFRARGRPLRPTRYSAARGGGAPGAPAPPPRPNDEFAEIRAVLKLFPLYLLPPGDVINRQMFAGGGVTQVLDDGLLLTSYRSLPIDLMPGIGGDSAYGAIATTSIIAAIAIPSLLSSRKAAIETKAIGALRAITVAQAVFRRKKARYAHSFDELVEDGGLDPGLAANQDDYSGYKFTLVHPTAQQPEKWRYGMAATPVVYGDSGELSFYTNVKSTIWQRDFGGPAAPENLPQGGRDPGDDWSVAGGDIAVARAARPAVRRGPPTDPVAVLKAVNTACATARRRITTYPHSLEQMRDFGGLDANIVMQADNHHGYRIVLIHPAPDRADKWNYGVVLTPVRHGGATRLTYYSNSTALIWQRDFGGPAPAGGFPAQGARAGAGWRTAAP